MCLRYGCGRYGSSCRIPIAKRLFHLADLVELVLEVNAAEEEGHHRIEAETERLGAVEVLFQRIAQGEAGDETNDPCGKTDQVAKNAVMRMNVVGKSDEEGPRTAEVEHDQHRRGDVERQSFTGRLNS